MELQVIRASEFIRLDVHEHLDFEASKGALQSLVLACRKRGLDRALLDLRRVPVLPQPYFTPAQITGLVSTFQTAGFGRHQRLAVLYQTDIHHRIRAFAFVNRMHGLKVQAVTDFETALAWLSEEKATPDRSGGLGVRIPITASQRRSKTKPTALPRNRRSRK